VLRTAEATGDAKPIQVSVRDVFVGSATVSGLRVTQKIPFDGEAELFRLQPNTYDYNPPRGEVSGTTLILGMEVRETEAEQAIQYIEETRKTVQTWIDRQSGQLEQHNAALPEAAIAAVQRRRATLGKASDIASRLSGR
jgi:hypothetical protein